MKSSEFSPHELFNRVMRLWWIVLLATILGGTLGFIFYLLHPPIYEATATFFVTLDLERFPIKGLSDDTIQYNEDMALGTTQGALISADVRSQVISQVETLGISLSPYDLVQNSTIERKHDIWELRFRSRDPQDAQLVVNTWAKIGYQAMLSWQATGKAPEYVIFQAPTEALVPMEPVLYGRNNLMLAGALIGFIVGIFITSLLSRSSVKTIQPGVHT